MQHLGAAIAGMQAPPSPAAGVIPRRRDRRPCTRGSACTSSGRPWAILRPNSSTTTRDRRGPSGNPCRAPPAAPRPPRPCKRAQAGGKLLLFGQAQAPRRARPAAAPPGCRQSARAISTIRCWPSERSPARAMQHGVAGPAGPCLARRFGQELALPPRRSSRSIAATIPAWPRVCAPSAIFSSTERPGNRRTCWKVRPKPQPRDALSGRLAGHSPARASRMLPPSGRSRPPSWSNIVLLPAPFGPIRATICPDATESPITASLASRPPNRLVIALRRPAPRHVG